MDYITVGEVLRAQGISGEVKVKPLTENTERFKKLRVLYIDDKPVRIMQLRIDARFVYLKLQGVDDRNAAELLRGKLLKIDRIHALDLSDGEYFIADLIGCSVLTQTGEALGKITDVLQNSGTADVIEARDEKGVYFRFPFLNRLIDRVDVEKKEFRVFFERLQEVCVYDD